MQSKHRPLASSSGLVTTNLSLATVTREKRRISDLTPIRLFDFYPDNAVVAVASSETAEPFLAFNRSTYCLLNSHVNRSVIFDSTNSIMAPVGESVSVE